MSIKNTIRRNLAIKSSIKALKSRHFIAFIMLACLFVAPSNALTSFDLHNINAAHAQGYTGKGVNIGIVDTIFNPNHELLNGKFLTPPINNTYTPSNNPHANHVAGIAAAVSTNGESYGIAYGSQMVGYGNLGVGVSDRFVKMTDYNVKIINNSHTAFHQPFVNFAKQDGILIVYAIGNDSKLNPIDAAMHGIGSSGTTANNYNIAAWLAVGNIDSSYVTRQNDGSLSVAARAVGGNSSSTHLCGAAKGYCLMAAGEKIYSAGYENGTYVSSSGTSMAAPVVSGVAAILAQKFPFLDGKQLADIILSTANSSFTAPKMIYKRELNADKSFTYHIIYIDDNQIPKKAGTSEYDTTAISQDIKVLYGATVSVDFSKAQYYQKSKEEVFGQGIVDAAAALRGLAVIDINRLGSLDTDNLTGTEYAFYTINTNGANATFENDISQKKWDNKYQNSSSQTLLTPIMGNLDAGLLKKGAGTLSLGGHLLYKGATVVQEGELRLINGTRTAVQSLSQNSQALNQSPQTQALNENSQTQNLSQSLQTQSLNQNAQTQIFNENPLTQSLSQSSQTQISNENSTNSASQINSLSQNSATQANALNLNLPKPSSVALSTQSVPLSIAGEVLVQPNGTLSVDTDTEIAKSLENQGVLNVGLSSPSLLSVNESYTQKAGATLRLGFLVGNAANSALKATSYNIENNTTLIYKPLSASVASRRVEFNLQGMEGSLANFSQVLLDTSGYALKYTLLDDNKTLVIASNGNAYANFEGANESLAAVLQAMSEANINSDYTAFFTSLNSADFESYRQTLQSLDDTSHLRVQELVLLTQNKNTLEAVLNLQGVEGYFAKPSYMSLSGADTRANRLGVQLYANKATYFGGILGFLSYDKLSSDDNINSHALSLGFGAKNALGARNSIELFGGASIGGAINSAQKASQTLNFNTLFLSAYAGLDKNFALKGTNIAPTAFLSYHLVRNADIKDEGIEFNGSKLFVKSIMPTNMHFLSANVGVNLRQDLSKTLNAKAYGFYERRILGELESEGEFEDYAGKFTQKLPLSADLVRFGLSLDYETPKEKTQFVLVKRGYKFQRVKKKPANRYFLSLGLEGELGLGDDEYKGFGANLKGGVRF